MVTLFRLFAAPQIYFFFVSVRVCGLKLRRLKQYTHTQTYNKTNLLCLFCYPLTSSLATMR